MYTVYVIRSQEGFRYTGQCADFTQRLEQHNSASLSFWTKRGSNWVPTYLETYSTRSEALARESWLKSGVGRDYLATHEAQRWTP